MIGQPTDMDMVFDIQEIRRTQDAVYDHKIILFGENDMHRVSCSLINL